MLVLKINLFEIERGHTPNNKKKRSLQVKTKKSQKQKNAHNSAFPESDFGVFLRRVGNFRSTG